ncbi:TIGR03435 family protein [Silvibacterium sp.]|uniref:TIGR03435 family protein n=1 Tax=Silvibacterium sp. TaxID=1964179 RepID=UPI0039E7152C
MSVVLCLFLSVALWDVQTIAGEDHPAFLSTGSDAVPAKDFRFDVVSIRPVKPGVIGEGVTFDPTPTGYSSNLTLWMMVAMAYSPDDHSWDTFPMLNMPKWMYIPDWYTIRARISDTDIALWRSQGPRHELLRAAMRDLLKTRCNLQVHEVPAEFTDFTLVVGKKGLKGLKPSDLKAPLPSGGASLATGGVRTLEGSGGTTIWHFYGAQIGELVEFLAAASPGRQIHDKTGLTGRYDFSMTLVDNNPTHDRNLAIYSWPVAPLGLELRTGKYEGFKLVIDHIDKPSTND